MLFSNFVATIRADLETIREDLGEFVETVKTDTTTMLGLQNDGNGGTSLQQQKAMKYAHWEEELWENPDLLCEDPQGSADWEKFCEENPQAVNDEEVEQLLSGNTGSSTTSDIIPELYRELVPARATHNEFFKRLVYHRKRLTSIVRTRMDELVKDDQRQQDDEEEARWEDDDDDIEQPQPQQTPIATPQPSDDRLENENAQLKQELDRCKEEMQQLSKKVLQLEQALAQSEANRKELESKLEAAQQVKSSEVELPHKKVPPTSWSEKSSSSSPSTPPLPVSTLPVSSTPSWEALPASPQSGASSSNDEPVVVNAASLKQEEEEEEEDDWE